MHRKWHCIHQIRLFVSQRWDKGQDLIIKCAAIIVKSWSLNWKKLFSISLTGKQERKKELRGGSMKASEWREKNALKAKPEKLMKKTSHSGSHLLLFCLMLAHEACCHASKQTNKQHQQSICTLKQTLSLYFTSYGNCRVPSFCLVILGHGAALYRHGRFSVSVMPLHVCA